MTTYFDFAPSSSAPFQFQPTLDGATYTVVVPWCLWGRRPYVDVYALDGTLVATLPLLGSPVGAAIESLTWASGIAAASIVAPHGLPIGATAALTISGCSPGAYNGKVEVLVTGRNTFSWAVDSDPGGATVLGVASPDLNIVAGYFEESSLVYRAPNAQFEVSP